MRRMARGLAWPLVVIATLWGATEARAQPRPPLGDFSAIRVTPAPGLGNYFMVDGGRVSGALAGSAGVTIDYAHQPLRLYPASCDAMA